MISKYVSTPGTFVRISMESEPYDPRKAELSKRHERQIIVPLPPLPGLIAEICERAYEAIIGVPMPMPQDDKYLVQFEEIKPTTSVCIERPMQPEAT